MTFGELTPAQKIIASDTHRFRVGRCGRRFGKTVLGAFEMIGVAVAKNDRRVPYYAPTRDDARDIMWNTLTDIALPITTYKNESRLELKVRTQEGGESLIVLYGWEAVKDRQKGRGVANDFILCDEVSKYKEFWLGWEEVLRPTLTDRTGDAMFLSTPNGFNHFYDLCNLENTDQDYKSFHFTTYDNPYIAVSEIEKAKGEVTEDRFWQEYMADFRKTTGLIYKEFSRDRHLYDEREKKPLSVVEKGIFIDWGYTNPTAVLTGCWDGDENLWIQNEWYKTQKTKAEIVAYAQSLTGNCYYPDPEDAEGVALLRKSGLNVREVDKTVVAGIDRVREMFKQNKLFINRNCVNLIGELEMYHYKEKRSDQNEPEVPVKEDDHAVDALRYGIMGRQIARKAIRQFRPNYAKIAYGSRPKPQTYPLSGRL